ncbi:hypothetical protein G3T14_01465 [Methylobacterium sp. BTF04]|uniref:hypothetical protein n=1 Tax=Methylobacterium sp. BTF04 TaxID=2708300 RepID=UPI0013D77472|nr:hypothetical protein [Methylobacterium sp. BTF04]NEU10800.1 hypothetical protein [Methylobacterium sp. BTF04]
MSRCVRTIETAFAATGPSASRSIDAALDELEAHYPRVSERVVALEAVFQAFAARHRGKGDASGGTLISALVDRRQDRLIL